MNIIANVFLTNIWNESELQVEMFHSHSTNHLLMNTSLKLWAALTKKHLNTQITLGSLQEKRQNPNHLKTFTVEKKNIREVWGNIQEILKLSKDNHDSWKALQNSLLRSSVNSFICWFVCEWKTLSSKGFTSNLRAFYLAIVLTIFPQIFCPFVETKVKNLIFFKFVVS